MRYCIMCVCVIIPFNLDVRLVDAPAGVTQDFSTFHLWCLPKRFFSVLDQRSQGLLSDSFKLMMKTIFLRVVCAYCVKISERI